VIQAGRAPSGWLPAQRSRRRLYALARTERDWTYDDDANLDGASTGLWLAMAFVLLVAACSLTVSVVAGLIERKRPFAALRASGVRLGELRQIALLETPVPLVLTVLGGVGTALLVSYVSSTEDRWTLPGLGFFLGTGAAVLIALAMCMVTFPLMDVTTRHDNVRFVYTRRP
jgi:predicted lysophospholipase L1 biosynthesis ABC-type transport system permease subunit